MNRFYLIPADVKIIKAASLMKGFLLGVALSSSIALLYMAKNGTDLYTELACTFPRDEGEMTVAIIENGKVKCWRWR